jgi:ribonuclease G
LSRELIVETTPFGATLALIEDGRLIEVDVADRQAGAVRGQFFLGRVRAIDKRLNAAFVDCGLDQPAWLSARDAIPISGSPRGTPIDRQLHEGQAVLVQGSREPQGGKGARLTGDLALAGLHLVHQPRRAEAGLSARLGRSAEAKAQRVRAQRLFPDGGFMLRSAAPVAEDAVLLTEADRLRALWRDIEARAATAKPPTRVYGTDTPCLRLVREHLSLNLSRIAVDDAAAVARIRAMLDEIAPQLADRLELLPDAFERTGAREQLEAALVAEVPMPGGGSLRIEPTAALTAIDVDGAGRRALDADLEAAREIARQLRLRRIGGTVVVDFIDMPVPKGCARLRAELKRALADDPAVVRVFSMSTLGLVAISRQRTGFSLAELLGRGCPVCAGTGRLPALRRQAEALMQELASMTGRPRVVLADDLFAYLQGDAAAAWSGWLDREGRVPEIQVRPDMAPGTWRIEETS